MSVLNEKAPYVFHGQICFTWRCCGPSHPGACGEEIAPMTISSSPEGTGETEKKHSRWINTFNSTECGFWVGINQESLLYILPSSPLTGSVVLKKKRGTGGDFQVLSDKHWREGTYSRGVGTGARWRRLHPRRSCPKGRRSRWSENPRCPPTSWPPCLARPSRKACSLRRLPKDNVVHHHSLFPAGKIVLFSSMTRHINYWFNYAAAAADETVVYAPMARDTASCPLTR